MPASGAAARQSEPFPHQAPVNRRRVAQRHFEHARLEPHLAGAARLQRLEILTHAIQALGKVADEREPRPRVDVHATRLRQERLDAGGDRREHIVGVDGRRDRRAPFAVGGGPLHAALHVQQVEVELPRLGAVSHDPDDRALDLVVEAERRQQRVERLTQTEPLQLTAKGSGRVLIDRQAELRPFDEQAQHFADRHRLFEAERSARTAGRATPRRRVDRSASPAAAATGVPAGRAGAAGACDTAGRGSPPASLVTGMSCAHSRTDRTIAAARRYRSIKSLMSVCCGHARSRKCPEARAAAHFC